MSTKPIFLRFLYKFLECVSAVTLITFDLDLSRATEPEKDLSKLQSTSSLLYLRTSRCTLAVSTQFPGSHYSPPDETMMMTLMSTCGN